MGTASEFEMGRGGEGGGEVLLLFTFVLYLAAVSEGAAASASSDRWYRFAASRSPDDKSYNWRPNFLSRFRRDANSQQARSHYLKRQGLYGRSQQFQRLMKRDGGGGERGVLSNANLGLETSASGGMLRICDRRGRCYDSRLVDPVRAWVQSPRRSMPWIPLENYDTDIANIASNFFNDRRRYVYPWNSHPFI